MACEVCEHCQAPLYRQDVVVREGYSYHRDCHKCYVCSETNLANAEVFKGVIFCSSCSEDIFRCCSAVRDTKNQDRGRWSRERSRRRESTTGRRSRRWSASNVVELRRGRTESDSRSDHCMRKDDRSRWVEEVEKEIREFQPHVWSQIALERESWWRLISGAMTLKPQSRRDGKADRMSTELAMRVRREVQHSSFTIKNGSTDRILNVDKDTTEEQLKEQTYPMVEWRMVNDGSRDTKSSSPAMPNRKKAKSLENWLKPAWSAVRVADPSMVYEDRMALSTKPELVDWRRGPQRLLVQGSRHGKPCDMGMTTDITHDLLKELNYPIVEWQMVQYDSRDNRHQPPAKPLKKKSRPPSIRQKPIWSDLRIAELGASTEIGNVALRKRSRLEPTIVEDKFSPKSQNQKESFSNSYLSDALRDETDPEWASEEDRSGHEAAQRRFLDRAIGSIITQPYKFFKYNILDRSSRVSVVLGKNNNKLDSKRFVDNFRHIFREEIAEHHKRGQKKLYSTILRFSNPYKLGWLHLPNVGSRRCPKKYVYDTWQCRHYRYSHSYRCLRAQVMARAGPTKSELAILRGKIKRVTGLPLVLMKLVNNMKYPAIAASAQCGRSIMGGVPVREHSMIASPCKLEA